MKTFVVAVVLCIFCMSAKAEPRKNSGPVANMGGPVAVCDVCGNDCVCGDKCDCPKSNCPCVGVSYGGGWASGTTIVGAPAGKTWIVTAKHVLERGGDTILHEGKTYTARTVSTHPTADVAVLEVSGTLPAACLASAKSGDSVTLRGYGGSWSGPQPGAFNTPRSGRVSYTGNQTMGVCVHHGPGDSGAGYLVGVLSGGYPGTQSSVGVTSQTIREILPSGSNTNDAPSESGAQIETIITPDGSTKQVWTVRNPQANQPGCVNGRCPINGPSSAPVANGGVFVGGGGCTSGSCGSSVSSNTTTTVTMSSGMTGRQPRLRMMGGPGLIRSFFGGRCR